MNSPRQTDGTTVLCWPKRLLSADDLRRHLTSQREILLLPRTVITPLAADEIRAKGVRVLWQVPQRPEASKVGQGTWVYAQEKSDALVAAAVKALERDGLSLTAFDIAGAPANWSRKLAEAILAAPCNGGIVFCSDPALVCCLTNKIAGMRAAAVVTVAQAARARSSLGPNLFAIEMPGRTLFEIRQMLKTIITGENACPADIANALKEMDGHAHR